MYTSFYFSFCFSQTMYNTMCYSTVGLGSICPVNEDYMNELILWNMIDPTYHYIDTDSKLVSH